MIQLSGKRGPYQHLLGYDYIIQAMGGLMSITGSEASGPMKVGVAISDIKTGLYASIGILAALNESGIYTGPINKLEQLFNDEQVKAREMVKEIPHPTAGSVRVVGSPLKLSRTPVEMKMHPPLVGEHTEKVLMELGLMGVCIPEEYGGGGMDYNTLAGKSILLCRQNMFYKKLHISSYESNHKSIEGKMFYDDIT